MVALCELPRPQLYAADDDDDDPSRSGQTMAFDRNYTVEIFEKFLAIIIIIL